MSATLHCSNLSPLSQLGSTLKEKICWLTSTILFVKVAKNMEAHPPLFACDEHTMLNRENHVMSAFDTSLSGGNQKREETARLAEPVGRVSG